MPPHDWPARCWWAGSDPLLVAYHDDEWGRPSDDEAHLFEMLSLEGFQAGLSWLTILRKREAFRRAFAGWQPAAVAAFDDRDRTRLLADAGIVRNHAKVDATIGNAQALLAVLTEEGSFVGYLRGRVAWPPLRLPPTAGPDDVPVTTPAAEGLSRDMRRRGFRFVGPTIIYSFMQATGLVDDHVPGCFRYSG